MQEKKVMVKYWAAGLACGMLLGAPAMAMDHAEHLVHISGKVEARYRAEVKTNWRQTGLPAPGGRAATLRCAWTVSMQVHRDARLASGAMATRTIDRGRVLDGARPGWCKGQEAAIAREVAQRTEHLRSEMLAVVSEDRAALLAEADRIHGDKLAG